MIVEDVVRAGDTVELLAESGGNIVSYEIVKATKSHGWLFGQNKGLTYIIDKNQVSTESPLGKALLGHCVGESVMGYRIERITKGPNSIVNVEDEWLAHLASQSRQLEILRMRLTAGSWVDADVESYENRAYPVKKSKTAIRLIHTDLRKSSILTGLSVSNTEIKDVDLVQICLSLHSSNNDADIPARAEMLVSPTTIIELGLEVCPVGKMYKRESSYSVTDANASLSFHPPLLEARVDPQTKQFYCRKKGGNLASYYLCVSEQQLL